MEDTPLLRERSKPTPAQLCVRIALYVILVIFFLYILIISIATPIALIKSAQAIAQNALNAAAITFTKTDVSNATATSVDMNSYLTVKQSGPFPAKVDPTTVVVSWDNIVLGTMDMPNQTVKEGNIPSTFWSKTTFKINNSDAFRLSSVELLNGRPVVWHFSGPMSLHVTFFNFFKMSFDLQIEKDVFIVGYLLENVTAYDIDVVKGEKDRLISSAWQSLYNPSKVRVFDVGDMTFESYLNGVKIGETIVQNFHMERGANYDRVETSIIPSDDNSEEVTEFFSNWAQGIPQTLRIKGPISNSRNAPFLNNMTDMDVIVYGSHIPNPVLKSSISQDGSDSQDTNAYNLVMNPLSVPVNQTDMNFYVYLENMVPYYSERDSSSVYVGYDNDLGQYPDVRCPAKDCLGMVRNRSVILAPSTTTFVAMEPVLDLDYCNAYRSIAVCCGFFTGAFGGPANTTGQVFYATTIGTMQVTIGEFSIQQKFKQQHIPVTCANNTDLFYTFCYDYGIINNVCQLTSGSYCNI